MIKHSRIRKELKQNQDLWKSNLKAQSHSKLNLGEIENSRKESEQVWEVIYGQESLQKPK